MPVCRHPRPSTKHAFSLAPAAPFAVYERVLIPSAVRAALAGHAASIPGHETGGILLGYPVDDTTLTISRASPPGPRALHSRFSFLRDTRFLQQYLDSIHNRSEGREDYVGEWHVHPALDAPPSRTDRRSLWRIARRKNYATDNPVLIIVEQTSAQRCYCAYGFVVKPKRAHNGLCVESMP
jgi:integrative and conjugative element protein (TIGR02256 family)